MPPTDQSLPATAAEMLRAGEAGLVSRVGNQVRVRRIHKAGLRVLCSRAEVYCRIGWGGQCRTAIGGVCVAGGPRGIHMAPLRPGRATHFM